MADSGTRDRVARLAAIRAETAAKLGYSGSDAGSGADREKIELVAAWTLQRELLNARMLSGHDIPPDALAKLSEQINAALPARSTPNFLEVRFIDPSDAQVAAGHRDEAGRLRDELAELRQQLREAHEKLRVLREAAPVAPASAPGATPARDNVIPMHSDDSASWAALAAVNSHLMGNPGGVLFDASDPDGRRSGKL